jgi:diaminopimelate decarboxylase
MKYILYNENSLFCEEIPVKEVAEEYGTPLYVYSKNQILENFQAFNKILETPGNQVCYALKANANSSILRLLAGAGAGADVVSGGELYLALNAGFAPEKIVFAGAGKREDEIEYALRENIFSLNVESTAELQTISRLALRAGKKTRVSLRINPEIDAQSHPYITTGLQSTKFGIEGSKALEVYQYAKTLPSLELIGIHTHIGSQITKIDPFTATANFVAEIIGKLRAAGIHLTHIDFGGGFGISYSDAVVHEAIPRENSTTAGVPSAVEFLDAILPVLRPTGCSIWIEPGRTIVANAGLLVTRVISVKENSAKKFIIVDSGMNDLLRPSLYDAYHQIVPLSIDTYEHEQADIVGPLCENSDFFAHDRLVPKVKTGDYLAILTAGAYGFVLSSNYNGRPRPAEILVNGDRLRVIRPRQTWEELAG